MLRRRLLSLSAAALPLALAPRWAGAQKLGPAPLSAADRADVARVEAYMNSVRALQARFTQVAPDRSVSTGQAWLVRPGRMRFQYDPPAPYLLVGGHGLLVFHDAQLRQTSNIPLDSTPIGLLLQDRLSLSGEVTIVGFGHQEGQIQVSLVRTRSPQDGVLTLVFSDNPIQLRGWTVLDAQRQQTRITLSDIRLGGTYPDSLFQFIDPKFFGNNGEGGG